VKGQSDVAVLVNISAQKWPPRHRTYFGSLDVRFGPSRKSHAASVRLPCAESASAKTGL